MKIAVLFVLLMLAAPLARCATPHPSAAAAPVPAGELDSAIETVVARPEFAWRLPRERLAAEEAAGETGIFTAFWRNAGDMLRKAAGRVWRVIRRWGQWIDDLLEKWDRRRAPRPSARDLDWQTSVRLLMFALLAASASVLAILLLRLWKRRARARAAAAVAVPATPDIRDDGVKADALPSDEWLRLAGDYAGRGDYRLAMRAVFLACLSHLARCERLTVAAFKSNREYMRELERRARGRPALRAAFAGGVSAIEHVWYGTRAATADDLARLEANRRAIFEDAPPERAAGAGTVAALLMVVLLGLFAFGVARLFTMRFRAGDVYPAYSSLRSDPLGTRILYEALSLCEGVAVERLHEPLAARAGEPAATVLFLGAPSGNPLYVDRHAAAFAGGMIRDGGRLVVTFMPRNWKSGDGDGGGNADKGEEEDEADAKEPKERKRDEDRPEAQPVSLMALWGVGFEDLPADQAELAFLAPGFEPAGLPPAVSCHTSLVFTNGAPEWRTVYARRNRPVIIARDFGRGSVVLSAMSYFVSNEAMRRERHPALLAWLLGPHRRVVFDEYERGLARQRGVATLARQYGLQWFAAGLLLLALLFVWRGATVFVPPPAAAGGDARAVVAAGKDSKAGLTNLLRRSIPPGAVLATCVAEWRRSLGSLSRKQAGRCAELEQLAREAARRPPGKRNLAATYSRMCEIAKRR